MYSACLDEKLTSHDIGVCLTDFNGIVLCQNETAARTCGSCVLNQNCRMPQFDACRAPELRRPGAIGAYRFTNQIVGDDRYDVYVVNNGKALVRMIYRLTEKYATEMREFEQYAFTMAQRRVLKRLIERATTGAIAREMSVSEDTIRSHIKAIYRKVSPASRRILKEIRMEKSRGHD